MAPPKIVLPALLAVACSPLAPNADPPGPDRPNIVLLMADDLGWGDPGFQGNETIRTPELDSMAAAGMRFTRFYSGAPVCSPTRGSALTGRHPYRYGIVHANKGHLPAHETHLAPALRELGYRTGHFGKWHVGTLTRKDRDSNRGGPQGVKHYAPPWERGFDVCFSTEAKVPTWNPMVDPEGGGSYGTAYWVGEEMRATENLEGDDSRIIMDRAIPFVRGAAASGAPFFAVIWFHTPHLPVIAGPDHLAPYSEFPEKEAHYYGAITAMDEQIGRLRAELRELGIARDTMLFFCSDNGPEGQASAPGSTGGLRGRKRSLHEGGIRVPAIWEWPARIEGGGLTDSAAVTSDYLPTLFEVLGLALPADRESDGTSLLPLLDDPARKRPRGIAFQSGKQIALIEQRWKLIGTDRAPADDPRAGFQLYDLTEDPTESRDRAAEHPEIVERMARELDVWRDSCRADRIDSE
jgi:arylsulfatase A-like enzyme